MTRISLLETAHKIIQKHLHQGDIAIDATCGNGHDTVFLAQLVENTGHVYAFDIQSQAITATTKRLSNTVWQQTVSLIQASHAEMADKIPTQHHGYIQAIMFNLGYLPGSDKSRITQTHSTLKALTSAIALLAKSGILTIMVYPGHPGGREEAKEVNYWLTQMHQDDFIISTFRSRVDKPTAPTLYIIEKC